MPSREIPRVTCLCDLPLSQFVEGQPLVVTFMDNGHSITCNATFIGIERGLVKVKLINVSSPNWYSFDYKVNERYPDHIGRFRAKKCYLWGKGTGDSWERCHWFKDTKTPAS